MFQCSMDRFINMPDLSTFKAKQRRKGKIFECRVPKNSKEIRKLCSAINAKE